MRTITPKIHGQRGITLVESLVALVVLSVGMLGIAGLYISSLKAGRSALVRTQAVALASDIADRIRANRLGAINYDTSTYTGGPRESACVGTSCAPDVLAKDDLGQWLLSITQLLPRNAVGRVVFGPGGVPEVSRYTITISWLDESGDTSPNITSMVVEL